MANKTINKLILIVAIAVLTAGALFPGCSGKKKSTDYYPLGVGSFWEYNVLTFLPDGVTRISKEIIKVVGKERVGDMESYMVDRYTIEGNVPPMSSYREYLAKTEEGVLCTQREFPILMKLRAERFPSLEYNIRHESPEVRFKNNLKEGDSWKWQGYVNLRPIQEKKEGGGKGPDKSTPPKIQRVKGTMDYKYLGKDTVHVMNKDFDCAKISLFAKSEDGSQELESTIWYAQGIGKVREEQKFFKGSTHINYLFELCDYNITNRQAFKGK